MGPDTLMVVLDRELLVVNIAELMAEERSDVPWAYHLRDAEEFVAKIEGMS